MPQPHSAPTTIAAFTAFAAPVRFGASRIQMHEQTHLNPCAAMQQRTFASARIRATARSASAMRRRMRVLVTPLELRV